MRLTFKSVDFEWSRLQTIMWVALIQSVEGLKDMDIFLREEKFWRLPWGLSCNSAFRFQLISSLLSPFLPLYPEHLFFLVIASWWPFFLLITDAQIWTCLCLPGLGNHVIISACSFTRHEKSENLGLSEDKSYKAHNCFHGLNKT